MKKIAVIGSRDFTDKEQLNVVLSQYIPFILVSGGAKGADQIAEAFADSHQLEKVILQADWKRFGRGAGHKRNITIVDTCDEVIAFWNGQSRGTKQAIDYAGTVGKPVTIIAFDLMH